MESVPAAVPFSLKFKMVVPEPSSHTLDSISTVRASGMFMYHGINVPSSAGMSGFGLTDHGEVSVGINYPGELRVRFSWMNPAASGDRVQMLSTKYSCTGFNTWLSTKLTGFNTYVNIYWIKTTNFAQKSHLSMAFPYIKLYTTEFTIYQI
jgi:hypothetical protein